jgi:hypothetical protein
MIIGLILVYAMLSVELSIGWLKIRCARVCACAHCIFDRCLGAFINTLSKKWCVLPHYFCFWAGSAPQVGEWKQILRSHMVMMCR